jgi:hypothetical protein
MRKQIMPASPVKPFLISKGEDGQVRLTVRETRRNSQDYPWVLSTLVDQQFATLGAARSYAVEHLGAKAGEFASK